MQLTLDFSQSADPDPDPRRMTKRERLKVITAAAREIYGTGRRLPVLEAGSRPTGQPYQWEGKTWQSEDIVMEDWLPGAGLSEFVNLRSLPDRGWPSEGTLDVYVTSVGPGGRRDELVGNLRVRLLNDAVVEIAER